MHRAVLAVFVSVSLLPAPAGAGQNGQPAAPSPRLALPTVTVTAQKEPADPQRLPISVTTVPQETLWDAKVTSVSEASIYAPNTWFNEFSARKLSNAFVRGVGSSPGNPGVTTYIDGVPQLNANSSNMEFVGVSQVEFVRGAQSALFGRNTLGGVINIASERPSLTGWSGSVVAPFGNFATREVRGAASGPVTDRLSIGLAGGRSDRDGYTVNPLSGNDLDSRSATFGKVQALWIPSRSFETRVIVSGERARDGDYALGDLEGLRRDPFTAPRDYEGRTSRDLFNTTVSTRYEGARLSVTSTTGFINWSTADETDLDYTPLPAATRTNDEEDFQFTQEVRVASATAAPLTFGSGLALRWQAGVFVFTQNYDQLAVNRLAPFVLSPLLPLPVEQTSPRAALDDRGLGFYGQGTLTVRERLDVTLGARFDHERKDAQLETFLTPPLFPGSLVDASESFSNVSPQVAVAYRLQPERLLYVSTGRGFKAGGFNPASPIGAEAYGEEKTWNVEGGLKATWAAGRVLTNATAFVIDWSDLQLNLPNPFVPAQFYIANVGGARTRGVEFDVSAKPRAGVDLFSSIGYTRATFDESTVSSGFDVSGNRLPNSPAFTFTAGAQLSHPINDRISVYGRAETTTYGEFFYDDLNRASQDAYSLANFRVGARSRLVFGEFWIKNAFDTQYVPLAFPYSSQSGFIGENGRPRTYGVSVGVTF
jgi:iron complex outermembrane receptor protein